MIVKTIKVCHVAFTVGLTIIVMHPNTWNTLLWEPLLAPCYGHMMLFLEKLSRMLSSFSHGSISLQVYVKYATPILHLLCMEFIYVFDLYLCPMLSQTGIIFVNNFPLTNCSLSYSLILGNAAQSNKYFEMKIKF